MQKKTAFYHNKDIDMLKLGFILPNLAFVCLHKSTDAQIYPSTVGDKDLVEKFRKNIVGGPFLNFTLKTVIVETFIRKISN